MNFKELWLSEETLKIIEEKWFTKPSPIQEKTIPILLNKTSDILWQSQTWTWKTAAFWLPIIENLIKENESKKIRSLILAPSRELAIQIWNELKTFIWKRKLNIFTIYWWQSYTTEKRAISKWIDILVWTPWRIIDHLNNNLLDFSEIEYFVLDEADEMLNMWFLEDIEKILKHCPDKKTTLLFSATMPRHILNIAKKYMNNYQTISVKTKELTSSLTEQVYYVVRETDKLELLSRIIDIEQHFYWIIFCRTKADVDWLVEVLIHKWYNVDSIHWDISQSQREKTIRKFKSWSIKILIATDVASRWLDVSNLLQVVNYSIPQNAEDYTHRIWRTWRAGKSWTAITFVSPSELRKINYIKSVTKSEIKQLEIPDIDFVLNSQIKNIIKSTWEIIDSNNYNTYSDLAKELLKLDKPEIITSSLLYLFLKDKLSTEKYNKINKVNINNKSYNTRKFGDNNRFENTKYWKGWTRLFIWKWRKDWMWAKKIVEYIAQKSWISERFINDMEVLGEFSFFSSPEKFAEQIIEKFKWIKKWNKPLVTYAKNK